MANQDNNGDRKTLLVGISNPDTAAHLIHLANVLAEYAQYNVVATHIVTAPPQVELSSMRGSREISEGRDVLMQVIEAGEQMGVEVRGVVEVARQVDEGLISAARNQDAEMLLVGFSERDAETGSERSFDRIMHRVARETESSLIIQKYRREIEDSILVTVATDANLEAVSLVVNALHAATGASVSYLHGVPIGADVDSLHRELTDMLEQYDLPFVEKLTVMPADSPIDAVIEEANRHDFTIVGAEPRPSLKESILGSWAERIGTQAESTVLVIRAKR
ncbi:MAG: universal stress protein [Armatimonadota bacterium]